MEDLNMTGEEIERFYAALRDTNLTTVEALVKNYINELGGRP